MKEYSISDIVGLIPSKINVKDQEITFSFTNDITVKFYHGQQCCEEVSISDINGDFSDLIGNPLLVAEERVKHGSPDSSTWTFYTFRGIGGSVDVTWRGDSNGCYSKTVDFEYKDSGGNVL